MTDEPQFFQIQAQWILDPSSVPANANQLLLQDGPPAVNGGTGDGVYVTFGHLNPPITPGVDGVPNPGGLDGQIFPVFPVGRFYLSLERLKAFNEQINAFIQAHPEK